MKVLVLYEEALLSTAQMDGGVYSLAMLSALNCGLYQQVPRIADRARKEGISLTEASCMYYLLYTGVLVLSCFMWSGALDRQLWYSSIIFYSITSIAYNQPPYWYLICPLLNIYIHNLYPRACRHHPHTVSIWGWRRYVNICEYMWIYVNICESYYDL